MIKKTSTYKFVILATMLSLFLAIALATLLLGEYSNSIQHYLSTIIPISLLGALTFTLILSLAMTVGLPRQITALSAGFVFGAAYGMALAMISTVLGCVFTLTLARKLFANLVQRHYPIPIAKVSHFFNHNTFLKAFIIRLLPAGSNFLTNVLAGAARSPAKPYILGSALGFVPQMVIFSMMGAGLKVGGQQQLIFSLVLLVIAIILSSYLYRKTHKSYTLN